MRRQKTFVFTVSSVISTIALSTFMTGLMSFFITALNTNEFPPELSQWIRAWMVGWAIGTPIVFFVAPISKKVGLFFSDDPRDK